MPNGHASRLAAYMQALHFDADDLSANQRGLLSERQRARLRGNGAREWAGLAATVTGMTALLAGCPAALAFPLWQGIITEGRASLLVGAIPFSLMALAGLWTGTVAVVMTHRGRRAMRAALNRDLSAGIVLAARVSIMLDDVGEHLYAVNEAQGIELYAELDDSLVDDRCIAYYLPQSNLLLALEPDTSA